MRNDSLMTWASARCSADLIDALCRSTHHAFDMGFKSNGGQTRRRPTIDLFTSHPASTSKTNVFTPPDTFTHAKDMRSNKYLVLRDNDLMRADHLIQQSITCTMRMRFSPPEPCTDAGLHNNNSNCTISSNDMAETHVNLFGCPGFSKDDKPGMIVRLAGPNCKHGGIPRSS